MLNFTTCVRLVLSTRTGIVLKASVSCPGLGGGVIACCKNRTKRGRAGRALRWAYVRGYVDVL